jgi:hypothetical protein
VLPVVLLVALACANPAGAQQSTRHFLFNMKSSSVYNVAMNGSALTSTYTSPNGIVRYSNVGTAAALMAVVIDTTVNTQPPSPPLLMSAGESDPGCVHVLWLPSGDPTVTGYEIGVGLRSVAGGDAPGYDQVVDAGSGSAVDVCQLSTGHYYVAVRARNYLGIPSAFSAELPVDVISTAVLISGFEASADGGAVLLEWDVFSDEALRGYVVYRSGRDDEGRGAPVHGSDPLTPATRSFSDETVTAETWYRYTLVVVREDGSEAAWLSRTVRAGAGILRLDQNAPNPFNPSTSISFVLPDAVRVRVDVFDVGGRRVRTLLNGAMISGRHSVRWDGTNDAGMQVASGTYFYRLTAGKRVISRKMLLLK